MLQLGLLGGSQLQLVVVQAVPKLRDGKRSVEWKARRGAACALTAMLRKWKEADSYEETPMFDPLWRIDVEDGYSGACHGRRANERGATPVEVLRPYVGSRIKKRCHFTGYRIVARNVWSLGRVALGASETQVLQRGLTTVLLGDDVVDFVRQDGACLRKLAVFAAVLCSPPHLVPQRRHQVALDSKSDKRALACMRSMNWPTRRYFCSSACSASLMFPRLFASSNWRMRSPAWLLN